MALPQLNAEGDLPPGVHQATLDEVVARFGTGTRQREAVTERLVKIYSLAKASGHLLRFVIFGSYITDKAAPADVDILLVVDNNFRLAECDAEHQALFYHYQAQKQL